MYDCLADEVRRVMMETVIPTITNLVKALKSKTTKEDSQVGYIMYCRLYLYTSILNVMGKMVIFSLATYVCCKLAHHSCLVTTHTKRFSLII